MTTQTNTPLTFVKTPAGSRIPKTGTLAYHPNIGFAEVIGRVGDRVRIRVTDFSEATDVTLRAGTPEETTISRQAWLSRVSEASDNAIMTECAVYDARAQVDTDALYGASPLVRQLQESVMSRARGANEMLVNLDAAASLDWEFDEYITVSPKRSIKKAKAPAPRPYRAPASKVGDLEDDARPDWLVAELNETFGNDWTPTAQA